MCHAIISNHHDKINANNLNVFHCNNDRNNNNPQLLRQQIIMYPHLAFKKVPDITADKMSHVH